MTAPQITIDSVVKEYSNPSGVALDGISLRLAPGSLTALIGVSGSGKSTLLRLLGGLDAPTSGRIQVGRGSPDDARRAKEIGWMAQHPALLPWRTAAANVSLAQRINPTPERQLPEVGSLLETVGLTRFADAYPAALSGGMKQRISLARTLAVGARIWLMDEPFASLDELTREDLTEDVMAIWAQLQPTVVWVTHSLQEAVRIADRVVVLTPAPGRIAATVDISLDRPRDDTSAGFQMLVREIRGHLATDRRSRLEATG